MYFHQGSKNLKIQKMIYLHFFSNILKIKIYFLLVYGGIVVKIGISHLFEMVLKCLFHAWEVMDNEIYKQHCFFLTCTCVLMLLCILQWIW
jgi:hypothetical protein